MERGESQKELLSQIEKLYQLLNGRTLQNQKATYEESFKMLRCAIIILAAIDLSRFEKYCEKINGYKFLDFFYREEVANYLKIDYDNSDLKIYDELKSKGQVKMDLKIGKRYITLTPDGKRRCYSKLALLESLADHFSDISLQNHYSKEKQADSFNTGAMSHTAKILKEEISYSLDTRKRMVNELITDISKWPEVFTPDFENSKKDSDSIIATDTNHYKRKPRILLVDDDQGTTIPFKLGLEEEGMEVIAFNDPLKALVEFKPLFYDILLLDIRMEGMNGFELAQELRKIDNNVRLCWITSFKAYYDSLMQEYSNMESKCFIMKPISITDLGRHIKQELGKTS